MLGKGLLSDQAHCFRRQAHAMARGEKNTGLPAANQQTAQGCRSCDLFGNSMPSSQEEVGLRAAAWLGPHRETWARTLHLCHRSPRLGPASQGAPQHLRVTMKEGAGPIPDKPASRAHGEMWGLWQRMPGNISGNPSRYLALHLMLGTKRCQPLVQEHQRQQPFTQTPQNVQFPFCQKLKMTWFTAESIYYNYAVFQSPWTPTRPFRQCLERRDPLPEQGFSKSEWRSTFSLLPNCHGQILW